MVDETPASGPQATGSDAACSGAPLWRVTVVGPGQVHDHRTRPCARCPWRTDADLTQFSEADMAMLRRADGRRGQEAPLDAPIVACHVDQPGTRHEFRWCAGWLATVGHDHLAVRIALLRQSLPLSAVEAGADWPALYADLGALLAAREVQLREQER